MGSGTPTVTRERTCDAKKPREPRGFPVAFAFLRVTSVRGMGQLQKEVISCPQCCPIVFGLQAHCPAPCGKTKRPETLAIHAVSGLSGTVRYSKLVETGGIEPPTY